MFLQLSISLASDNWQIWKHNGNVPRRAHTASVGRWYRPHCVRSVLATSVKILPYRPPARLIRTNPNTFSDWRRMSHVSLVKSSWRPKVNKTLPRETPTWTFDSYVIRSHTFETAANLFASRVKQIIFTQSRQLNGFKQELKKKLSSFNTINAPNLLTRRPTMRWEHWETSAKSKIWRKASKNLPKQT